MTKGNKFFYGTASSGPQSEGDFGKHHENIFEYWYKSEPGEFFNNVGPDVASDVYHQFETDILLMSEMGLDTFRTSIQWSRLIKDFDTCKVDNHAVDFYNRYFNTLIKHGIEPFVNLYHFDMPIELQNIGGWENRDIVDKYVGYAQKCFELFGDRIKRWFTMNEPIVPVEGGYLYQFHYPNQVDMKCAVKVAYHEMLASAKATEAYKNMKLDGEIGIILNLTPSYPKNNEQEHKEAAHKADLIFNRSFLDPAVLGKYPDDLIQLLGENDLLPEYLEADLRLIEENTVDILGVNFYQPRRIQKKLTVMPNQLMPESFFDYYEMPGRRMNKYRGWEIYPKALYDISINIKENYNNIKWFVSENGMGVENEERFIDDQGLIQDDYRINFIKEHLEWLKKGMDEGTNCIGYHLWTFVDNWSWKNAYKNRYGLVALDLKTLQRTVKKSGNWMKTYISNGGIHENCR